MSTLCTVGGAGCARQANPAALSVEDSLLHLKDGVPGEDLNGSFTLQNVGGETLKIVKLEADCGCAGLQASQEAIAPGGRAELRVRVRLKPDGQPLQFPVRIFTNDPGVPLTVLTVKAEAAVPPVQADPPQVNFGEIALRSQPVQGVRLVKPSGDPWLAEEAVEVQARTGLVQTRVLPWADGDSRKVVSLEVQPQADLPEGPFSDVLVIRSARGKRSLLVEVQGKVVPPLVVSPTVLLFSDADQQAGPMKRQVLVRRTDGKPLARMVRWCLPNVAQHSEESTTLS